MPDAIIPEATAVSLAIALRQALCQALGVESQEIGWAVQNNREQGIGYRDIYLFDCAAGGAGYVASARFMIEELFSSAREILNACNCDKACHSCLLDFGTQHHAEHLNRQAALAWLNDDFFAALRVPSEYCSFGPATLYEARGVAEGMLITLQKRPMHSVTFVVGGNANLWDVDSWPLWRYLSSISTPELGIETRLLLSESLKRTLPWSIVHSMVSKAIARQSRVYVVPDAELQLGGCRLAGIVASPGKTVAWGVFDQDALAMSANWGQGTSAWPVVKGNWSGNLSRQNELTLSLVESERPEDCTQVLVDAELDGDILNVGTSFWSLLGSRSGWLKQCLEQGAPRSIEYCDRYVRSPLCTRVLFEFLKRFASNAQDRSELTIKTTASPQLQTGHALHHDWRDDATQKSVLLHLFKPYFRVSVTVFDKPQDLNHSRFLSIAWGNGFQVEVNLDQGVGFYRTKTFKTFDFAVTPESQAQKLAALRFAVENQSASMPLYILKPK